MTKKLPGDRELWIKFREIIDPDHIVLVQFNNTEVIVKTVLITENVHKYMHWRLF
jgi:hypothetical protein